MGVSSTRGYFGRRVLAALVVVLAACPAAQAQSGAAKPIVIGEREWVRVSAERFARGGLVEARIDTGAFYSSVDRRLARRLGVDLEHAKRVDIRSSLGKRERPLVPIQLQIAGRTIWTVATVANRTTLKNKVLVGRRDLKGFLVRVGSENITAPGEPVARATARTLLTDLPLAAFLAVVARVVIGLPLFGVFAPVLLAIAFVNSGLVTGVAVVAAMLLAGTLLTIVLRPLRLPRVSRLAVLVALVSGTLLAADSVLGPGRGGSSWAMAFPVVITSVMVERFWDLWEQDGGGEALRRAAFSVLFAAGISELMVFEPVLRLSYARPVELVLVGALLSALVGRYHGLRATELVRFRPAADARSS